MDDRISRRDLIRAAALCAAGGTAAWAQIAAAAADVPADAFMAVSRRLTGHEDLDPEMGVAILQGFAASGRQAEIKKLVAGGADTTKIANDVVAAWYSGFSPDPKATEVAGFNSALVWTALTYTKPWASCGGETGYWADPPTG